MNGTAKATWSLVFSASLLFAACGDDDDARDAGGDAARDHDHEDGGSHDHDEDEDDAGVPQSLSFFVTSDTSPNGNLGGLDGADARCNRLAAAAGVRDPKFAAYLSTEKNADGDDEPIHARDRIGKGPWYNAKGMLVARDLDALHAIASGNADLFLNEKGEKINGQWEGSPSPNQHDILTGSEPDGRVSAGKTCKDWTSSDAADLKKVGHSDGLGPARNPNPPFASWNSSHDSPGCADTAPQGGAGKIYCFSTK
jgi:hypothetical protein